MLFSFIPTFSSFSHENNVFLLRLDDYEIEINE